MKEIWKTKKIRLILPGIHFILSFFYERTVFHFSENVNIIQTQAMNQYVSDSFERVEGYFFTKLFGLLFIFLLWKLVFFIIDHIKERTWQIFLGIYILFIGMIFLLYPHFFLESEDNVITYSYAIRFWPEYWHNAYSSFVYGGLLEVMPFPFAITVLQGTFFYAAIGYAMNRMAVWKRGKWLIWLLMFLPNILFVIANSYRTEQYTVLCLFAFTVLFMDSVERKQRTVPELIGIILMLALVSVWRTEGIIVGALGLAVSLIFTYQLKWRKVILYFALFGIAFLIVQFPQKVGNEKYYGNDYSFINSFPSLKNILNNENHNVDYPEYEEDLKALEEITPIPLLKYRGMDGYRRFNYMQGRNDINQSMAGMEEGAAYKKAYYRLVLKNPLIFAKTQINALMVAIGLPVSLYVESASLANPEDDLPAWNMPAWEIGYSDYLGDPSVAAYVKSDFYAGVEAFLWPLIQNIKKIKIESFLTPLFAILIPLLELYIVIYEGICLLKKKHCEIGLALFSVALLGQAAAIVLVMPAAIFSYFHAYYSCSVLLCIIYFLKKGSLNRGEIR